MFKLIALFALVAVIAAEPEADPQYVYYNPMVYTYPRATTYGSGYTLKFQSLIYTCFEVQVEPPPPPPAAFKKKRSAEADPQYVLPYPYVRPVVRHVASLPSAYQRHTTYGTGHTMLFQFKTYTCFEVQTEPPTKAPATF